MNEIPFGSTSALRRSDTRCLFDSCSLIFCAILIKLKQCARKTAHVSEHSLTCQLKPSFLQKN
uniref:Uncharacterized protein n=1 Tax=Lepeophtheirus salmonis TaxID=72036 RepID=A0A0K2TWH5_LEPSM